MPRILHSALFAVAVLTAAGFCSAAAAQTPCQTRALSPGEVIKGPVLHVTDDLNLCVAVGFDQWVEVAALPTDGPTVSRDLVMSAAFAKNAVCTAAAGGTATCRIEGQPLAALLAPSGLIKVQTWR